MRQHAARPFTLIELIVVMGVMILLAAISIPAYSSLFSGRRTTLAANQVNAAVMDARAHAVSAKVYTALIFLEDTDGCYRRFRMAELYHNSDSDLSPYKWRRWAPGSTFVSLPENTLIPDGKGNLDTVGSTDSGNESQSGNGSELPTVGLESDSTNGISAGNAPAIIFKPNGQLAGTGNRNVVVRFAEANRYAADKSGTPKLPLNINWLTCKTKFLDPVSN
jgi:type II secretory pathway pseudopilin PulG